MALLAFCGWEDNSLLEANAYGSKATLSTVSPRSGTYCLRVEAYTNGNEFNAGCSLALPTHPNEIYVQWAVRCEETFNTYPIVMWKDSNDAVLGGAEFGANAYSFYIGPRYIDHFDGTLIGTTESVGTEWSVIEMHIKIATSGGIVQVKKDGQLVIDYTGDTQLTCLANIASFVLGNPCVNVNEWYLYYDDIIIFDTTGGYMNTWPGGLRITRLAPTGAGNYAQWTPSTGANWECVNEVPPSDTDYVSSDTSGQKDSYVMADCGANVYDIKALVSRFYGSGESQIKSLLRIGGSDYLGSVIDLPSTGKVDDIRYINPATSQPFTSAEVNGLESGMEKQ
jgi:hypothetical protein